ncbi:hypothetical protein [Ruegeria sp.]|uniref:hypothetical protein n=1 Tax=Ruegeria sp. TaxID=1879320 RepID=UPI003B00E754
MAQTAFDTLSAAQRLEKEFGFPPKQAEGTAILLHEHLVGNVATKDDISSIRSEISALDKKIDANIKALRDEMATKPELQTVKSDLQAEISAAKYDLTWRLLGGIAILNGILFAAMRYLPSAG